MRDVRYLRAQADLCLEMARQMSSEATSKSLRAEAARYHAEAAEIEKAAHATGSKDGPEQS